MASRHIDNPSVQRANMKFIRASMGTPLLSREREQLLTRRWREKKDEGALHELITAHMRLVISIASKFRNYGLPLGDLIQEGHIGLMEAANRFEPERENRFSTYATWWVRAAIQDYVLRNWSIVRAGSSASQKSLFFNLRRLKAKLGDGNEASAQIARELDVNPKDVEAMAARFSGPDQSLNGPVADGEDTQWQDFLADERPDPESLVMEKSNARVRNRWLNEALTALSPRERTIIRKRQMTEPAATLDELGQKLGVSKERVRQIEQKALDKLRHNLTGQLAKAGLDGDKSLFFAA